MVRKMIISAEEIRGWAKNAETGRAVSASRRVRPEGPCKEAHRGCKGRTGKGHKRTAHGWCAKCYGRWYKYGDPFGHAPNTSRCTAKDCHHPETRSKKGKPMPVHTDSPSGQQWHVRYTPKNGDKGPYWSGISSTPEQAQESLKWHLDHGYDDAQLFEREVTPWKPVA